MSDLGDVLLSCFPALVYLIAALFGLWLATHLVRVALPLAVRWRNQRHRRRQQRGLDHLAAIAADQEHGHAEAQTEAISMRRLTAIPQLEEICPGFCDNLGRVGDPAECTCLGPCGRRWCTRLRELNRNPVPVAWEKPKERGWHG